ncbi:hypothetical protein EMIHUDRAFT_222459 [Emiliania huxleyi CCMP1516]|uniref:WW domain-containing protein n=2 Tax=Emiliania huxleyi TaxID=2903 RepID=A0A0D3KY75_EMIH1|nr:hypothetical protein EMIHUDRAFT_222459 [Emiliania huxleyi CCMP1516]EOD40710.1 hypothetical protein EMIHUDRAFT_222459 [Emiliania huxleyi CCMP1516]|eukprot:XP_005793139.1 hypothetical protein EMIHUDRAFT_222459 [Emiliania huxleyi CCMP1516]
MGACGSKQKLAHNRATAANQILDAQYEAHIQDLETRLEEAERAARQAQDEVAEYKVQAQLASSAALSAQVAALEVRLKEYEAPSTPLAVSPPFRSLVPSADPFGPLDGGSPSADAAADDRKRRAALATRVQACYRGHYARAKLEAAQLEERQASLSRQKAEARLRGLHAKQALGGDGARTRVQDIAAASAQHRGSAARAEFNYLKTGAGETERKALCICCSYPGTHLALPGCVRDQAAMVDLLPKQGYDAMREAEAEAEAEKAVAAEAAQQKPWEPCLTPRGAATREKAKAYAEDAWERARRPARGRRDDTDQEQELLDQEQEVLDARAEFVVAASGAAHRKREAEAAVRVQAMYRGHVVRAEAEAEALEKRRAECAALHRGNSSRAGAAEAAEAQRKLVLEIEIAATQVQQLGVVGAPSAASLGGATPRWSAARGSGVSSLSADDTASELVAAAEEGEGAAVCALLECGADPNGVDDEGTTPLMGAALGGHIGVVRDLLEAGAEVDIADGEGGVALHFCSLAGAPAPALSAARDHAPAVEVLLAAGVDPAEENEEGDTAADFGAAHEDVTEVLERHVERAAEAAQEEKYNLQPIQRSPAAGGGGAGVMPRSRVFAEGGGSAEQAAADKRLAASLTTRLMADSAADKVILAANKRLAGEQGGGGGKGRGKYAHTVVASEAPPRPATKFVADADVALTPRTRVYAKPAPPGRKPSESLQGWHATKTGDGRTYYYNDGGETSWERPGAEDLAV